MLQKRRKKKRKAEDKMGKNITVDDVISLVKARIFDKLRKKFFLGEIVDIYAEIDDCVEMCKMEEVEK